jgi:hypothetical protein
MKEIQLPAELEQVEQLLLREPLAEPSAALRRRVLDDVRAELRQSVLEGLRAELRREQRRTRWRFAAAAAAVLLVGLGLLLSVLQSTSFALQQHDFTPTLSDIAWQIQQISPQVSPKDSRQQAMLRQIGDEASSGTAVSKLLLELQFHHP